MNLEGRHVVVTGAASGIGRALAERMLAAGAGAVVAVDRDPDGLAALAEGRAITPVVADLGSAAGVAAMVAAAEQAHGPIDVLCANAGISGAAGGVEVDDDAWRLVWDINVMAFVRAARILAPRMAARGHGSLVVTASAAGLLMTPGFLPYTASKHAVVAVADGLAVEYGDRGVHVGCFCPQVVATPAVAALAGRSSGRALDRIADAVTSEQAADALIAGIRDERFLILTHPEASIYAERRANDHDRWIAGMRRLVRAAE